MLRDDTSFLQISDGDETQFVTPTTTEFKLFDSSENKWPTPAKPYDRYKYFSVELYLDRNAIEINRKTESFLAWLGGWDGLLDALNGLVKLLISPYSIYVLESKLSWLLLQLIPST